MNTKYLDFILKLNSIFLWIYLVLQVGLIFLVDTKLNLITFPGVSYLQEKSLFPTQAFNSLSVTILLGFFIFLINIPALYFLIKILLSGKNNEYLNKLNKKYRLIYFLGYGALNPFRILRKIKKENNLNKFFIVMFFIYCYFILFYFLLGWKFIDLPAPVILVSMVSIFKIFLYFLNVFIFFSIGFLSVSSLLVIFLIAYSFYYQISFEE